MHYKTTNYPKERALKNTKTTLVVDTKTTLVLNKLTTRIEGLKNAEYTLYVKWQRAET